MVLPLLFLDNLILLMLCFMHSHHLSLFLLQLSLILHHQLSVSLLLHCPLSLLLCFISFLFLSFSHLLLSLCIYFFDLIGSETFEVIWNVSVASVLRYCCGSIFSHNITIVSVGNLELIMSFLILSPLLFLFSFLPC